MIKLIEYDLLLPIWEKYLWPKRTDIKSMSSMQYPEGYDITVYNKYSPYFIAYYINDKIAGINSGHCSADNYFRSRGLYVFEEHRKKGIAVNLLKFTIELGKSLDCKYCWSVPRQTALHSYVSAGFKKTSNFFKTDTSENNCYVIINL